MTTVQTIQKVNGKVPKGARNLDAYATGFFGENLLIHPWSSTTIPAAVNAVKNSRVFLILILSAVGGVVWWWIRNNPGQAIDTAQDLATTIRNAPRRLAFRQQTKEHPVEGIDDYRIAVGAIALAFIELDDFPTKEQRQSLHLMLRTKLKCTEEEAQEISTLGRWLIDQCKGPNQAVSRLSRRLYKIDGDSSWDLLQDILARLVTGELSHSQVGGIDDIRLALRK